MKRTLLIFALVALVFLASCDRKTSDLTFTRIVAERTTSDSMAIQLASLSGNADRMDNAVEYTSFDIQFPSKAISEEVLHRLRQAVVCTVFHESDTSVTDIEAEIKRVYSTMKVTETDSCPVDPLAVPEGINATTYHTVSVRTITNSNSLYTFCLADDQYAYGAAHGFYSLTYHSYNSTTGNPLTFDSLFCAGADTEFYIYMVRQIPADYQESYGREFIFQGDPQLDHATFYFTADGVHFSFPPYVVGSYADGQIDCLIPVSIVKPLLKTEWQKLFSE